MPPTRLHPSPFGTRENRICAVAAAETAGEMARQVRAGLKETPTIELRLDWLKSDAERRKLLRWLTRQRFRSATFLATCRRKVAGGKLNGDIQAELFWLMEARRAGCTWCDVEVETERELPDQSIREYAVPARILLSMHDFERTPKLPRAVSCPECGEVDAVKIAAAARTIDDSVRLLHLARASRCFVAVPMGEAGLPGRLLALREGSALAYAPIGPATAPGQVSLHDLKYLYRAHSLTHHTEVYGVIGDPIRHSLSPLMHNTGYVARKRDAVYLPFLVHDLKDFLGAIPEFGIRGFSVTIPHKQTILKYLKDCEPLAAEIGAVNTVTVRRDGSLYGSNTDYVGVLRALKSKMALRGSRVLVFGAGGSARAAAFALARSGAEVFVCARREAAAKELSRAVGGEAIPRRMLRSQNFAAILNATPVGMDPNESASPLTEQELRCDLVMDLIYRPLETKLLKLAGKKGIATVSGLDMFLAQGFAQWEIWTKTKAPEPAMQRAVLAALRSEQKTR
ncbi:MAG TPA: shikimate dehydrogenase [Candidatus Dormibacteraeota bacterium]|nr:shikimate dehydrogenase [Candidatus Dormibacteraeota bacterium]